MSDHAGDYLARLAKLHPSTTVDHRRSVVMAFAAWYDASRRSPRSLSAWMVEDYLVGPGGVVDRVKAGTFNNYKSALAKFLEWGARRELWKIGAVPDLPNKRVDPINRFRLDEDQLDALLTTAPDPYTRWCLAALQYTLCREQELLRVRIADVNRDTHRIRIVRTKGARADASEKVDEIPMRAELAEEYDRWLTVYEGLCGPIRNDWYIIPARHGRPGGLAWVNETWAYKPLETRSRLGVMAKRQILHLLPDLPEDVRKGLGAHTLRRSGSVEIREALRNAGVSEADYIVMALLGHKSVETSRIYWGEDRDRTRRNDAIAGRRLRPKKAEVTELRAVEDAG
jgi:integrase